MAKDAAQSAAAPSAEAPSWVVCDLEATCWGEVPDSPARSEAEIIEIGAVRFDPHSAQILSEFHCDVRPTDHPQLSDFCTTLTGLTQARCDAAAPFGEVWPRFGEWLRLHHAPVTLLSWGDFDGRQLHRQIAQLGQSAPPWRLIDLKQVMSAWLRLHGAPRCSVGLHRALKTLGLEFEGTPHQALSDARNALRVLAELWDPTLLTPHAQALLRRLPSDGAPLAIARLQNSAPHLSIGLGRALKFFQRCGWLYRPHPTQIALHPLGVHAQRLLERAP